jgi:hypothetical protein
MAKFQITGSFTVDESFGTYIPEHRKYINSLINKNIIEHYVVSMESQQIWVTLSADSKAAAEQIVLGMPLEKYLQYEIVEVFITDGLYYRWPTLALN